MRKPAFLSATKLAKMDLLQLMQAIDPFSPKVVSSKELGATEITAMEIELDQVFFLGIPKIIKLHVASKCFDFPIKEAIPISYLSASYGPSVVEQQAQYSIYFECSKQFSFGATRKQLRGQVLSRCYSLSMWDIQMRTLLKHEDEWTMIQKLGGNPPCPKFIQEFLIQWNHFQKSQTFSSQ